MKKLSALLITLGLALTTLVVASGPANAVDRRPCVSLAEYRAIYRPHAQAHVRSILDVPGIEIGRVDDGYWGGEWVEDGYWDSYWVDDGFGGYWIDEWIDTSYWQDQWVSMLDTVRSYPKCGTWERGRIGVNFDNYTSAYSGLRLFTKVRSNPWSLAWVFGRTTGRVGPEKAQPQPDQVRPAKPESTPLTPDPHPNSGPKG